MKISTLPRQRLIVVMSILTFQVSATDELFDQTSSTNSSTDVVSVSDDVTNSNVITQSSTPSNTAYYPSSQDDKEMSNYDNEHVYDVIKSHRDENCTDSYGWNLKGSDWGCCGNYAGCCTYASLICYIHDAMCRCCDVSGNFCGPKCQPENDCSVKSVGKLVTATSVSGEITSTGSKNSGQFIFQREKSDVIPTSSLDKDSEPVEGSGETEFREKGLE